MSNTFDIKKISALLQHNFTRVELIERAFTHRSVVKNNKGSYERLEFIGDRVLGLVVSDMLLSQFPFEDEGALARRHTALVRAETLFDVANDLGIGEHISFGEDSDAMRCNLGILSDVVESCIGAIFRDGGLDAVRPFMETNFRHRLEMEITPPKDGKTIVQEWAQKQKFSLPRYELHERQGKDHEPIFIMAVIVDKHDPVLGKGKNKQEASQNSAENFIKKYGIE